MALKIRMSRGGRKGAPFYRIVVADSRAPRDGDFIERVGSYDPRLSQDNENRIVLNAERIQHWLGVGAQPSERIAQMLGKAGIIAAPAQPNRSRQNSEQIEPHLKHYHQANVLPYLQGQTSKTHHHLLQASRHG